MRLTIGRENPRYDPDRKAVTFFGKDGDKCVTLIVSREALNDRSGLYEDGERLVAIFERYREEIETLARAIYETQPEEGQVFITTRELFR
jgi:hypothetical protein